MRHRLTTRIVIVTTAALLLAAALWAVLANVAVGVEMESAAVLRWRLALPGVPAGMVGAA